ncbi:hypothetical protein [Streptomonospora litoralis]|uniref:Uncharacterized protein n=1 Tax=Streptomonospora litoralis TaxID=2498135 RepID=A0A4V0ZJ31_9ACTN|nr:hypothetical protein [Streptomonospora litoralis]QBI52062.1 hypothetical protein EKD16_01225 [Streptomonospora litoralis]
MSILLATLDPLAMIVRLVRPSRGLHAAPARWARFEPDPVPFAPRARWAA